MLAMRATVLMLGAILIGFQLCGRTPSSPLNVSKFGNTAALAATRKPDFDKEIKPILQARCQPCHFQGGKVYAKMPFDRPETITRLGTKLFTRIKDENEQRLIREFLAEP